MAVDCSYFCSSTYFMVCSSYFSVDGFSFFHSSTTFLRLCVLYCSASGIGMLVLPLFNGFPDDLGTVLVSGRLRFACSSTHQWLLWFSCRIAQQIAAPCYFFHSSLALTLVCAPYCSVDGSGLRILLLVDGFHCLCTVFLCGWPYIAHTSGRQWFSWFEHRIALQIAADCSFFHSLMALKMVCIPFCTVDECAMFIILSANRFTFCTRYCSGNSCGLLILPLVNK
jgi:hypothetical protein